MAIASDSSQIDSLSKIYEKKITEINFSLPSQIDYKLTEEENDSIFKMIEYMIKIKKERLETFKTVTYDTIGGEISGPDNI